VAFVRFVISSKNPDSGVSDGIFGVVYDLLDGSELFSVERLSLEQNSKWFNSNLQKPTRFNRSSSKGYFRRNTRGIAWFRDTATEHIARMHHVAQIVREHGYAVHVIAEERIGYLVYEDEHQVIAEPFADTRTGS
jgi:hypothetical protein